MRTQNREKRQKGPLNAKSSKKIKLEADGFIEDIIHPNVKEEVTIDGEAPRKFPCAQCKDGFITESGFKRHLEKNIWSRRVTRTMMEDRGKN